MRANLSRKKLIGRLSGCFPSGKCSDGQNIITDSYSYDENGNMTCRVENGQTFAQSFNAENRLDIVLLVNGTCSQNGTLLAGWAFTYDEDGRRVKQGYTGEKEERVRYRSQESIRRISFILDLSI